LPERRAASILDIGCGAGHFVYFLRTEGFTNVLGIDVDDRQVGLAREMGLNCVCQAAEDHFERTDGRYDLISILDVMEHLNPEELFSLFEGVSKHLRSKGKVIASVVNAESPTGLATRYADITHETAFTRTSIEELLFCHQLRALSFRDPFPAPVSPMRRLYRGLALVFRGLEAVRLRLMGLSPPEYWSPVLWFIAEKSQA
jgi:2-polyprenyl-3-methyl-5-hydroxy-6-metoxy-1,4-benzoquinol methylase